MDRGKNFAEAMDKMGLKPSVVAQALGEKPQNINHWKNRGVPAKYATRVATMLKVEPETISAVKAVKIGQAVETSSAGSLSPVTRPADPGSGDSDESAIEALFRDIASNPSEFTRLVVKYVELLPRAERIAIGEACFDGIPKDE